jgi:hypothetical protein
MTEFSLLLFCYTTQFSIIDKLSGVCDLGYSAKWIRFLAVVLLVEGTIYIQTGSFQISASRDALAL